MSRAFISVYVAAALSFGAGVFRDWQLVHHVGGYQDVFAAMYSVALAASFSVNAATLGHGFSGHRRRQWVLVAVSLVLFAVVAKAWKPMPVQLFWVMLPIPVLYVVGALHARRLVDTGHVLVGRMRDGMASLLMVVLIALGMQAAAFPVSVLAATAMIAIAAHWLARGPSQASAETSPMRGSAYIGTLFYSNVGAMLVNAWALWANSLEGSVFGVAIPVAVRVAVYFFQLFSLPSVLLARWRPRVRNDRIWMVLAWLCIALAAAAALLPLRFSIVVFPIVALACLYSSVLHLNASHFGKADR